MELQQRAFRTRVDYRFFEDYVEYTIRDRNGALNCFTVTYAALPGKREYGAYRAGQRPVTGPQIVLFAAVILLVSSSYAEVPRWEFALVIGACVAIFAGSILVRWRFRNEYTTIPTAKGKLLVPRNKQHYQVLQEMESHRRRELRKLAKINVANAPEAELRKFEWLEKEGAISPEEFEVFRQKVTAAAAGLNLPGMVSKPPNDVLN